MSNHVHAPARAEVGESTRVGVSNQLEEYKIGCKFISTIM